MSKLSKWLDFSDKSKQFWPSNEPLWEPIFNFQKEFNNLFNNFYRALPGSIMEYNGLNLCPYCDIVEDDKNFKVELEMPGVDEQDIKVAIYNGILSVKASKKTSSKNEGKNYLKREISYGSWERQITLPENIDVDNAQSSFKKGMLWVIIPKKELDKANKVELEVKKIAE